MTADDLTAPLGRQPKKPRRVIALPIPQIIAGVLALFLGVFVLWAVISDDPFGGEPMAVVSANLHVTKDTAKDLAKPQKSAETAPGSAQQVTAPTTVPGIAPGVVAQVPDAHAAIAPPPAQSPAANSTTVTIIDGKTGAKQEVVVPGPGRTGLFQKSPPTARGRLKLFPARSSRLPASPTLRASPSLSAASASARPPPPTPSPSCRA
jgi:hypothetical protein